MSAMKRIYEDIYELIQDGLSNSEITEELSKKYGINFGTDDWLTNQIDGVRIEAAKL